MSGRRATLQGALATGGPTTLASGSPYRRPSHPCRRLPLQGALTVVGRPYKGLAMVGYPLPRYLHCENVIERINRNPKSHNSCVEGGREGGEYERVTKDAAYQL
ncbi:hypothetical protein B296_00044459 [Ensete ventricosum]|uniref:Uncharacterized protein n=1 Tax=Ensete ventricosum TaxID=4639 RepID=A0A426X5T3_ENSVE|nr:hypothetical protein B296_00044459 [Ensete ventricosum]